MSTLQSKSGDWLPPGSVSTMFVGHAPNNRRTVSKFVFGEQVVAVIRVPEFVMAMR